MVPIHVMHFQTAIPFTTSGTLFKHQIFTVIFQPDIFTIRLFYKTHVSRTGIQLIITHTVIIMVHIIIWRTFICKTIIGILLYIPDIHVHIILSGNQTIRSDFSPLGRMFMVGRYIQRSAVFQQNTVKRFLAHITNVFNPVLHKAVFPVQGKSRSVSLSFIFQM